MEIETKNASLDTLAVTILALHVSGKQMTQAVFKQLPVGIEQEGDSLWGVVRYSIKNAADVWVVFSHDNKLYRRGLSFDFPFYSGKHRLIRELNKLEDIQNNRVSYGGYRSEKDDEEIRLIKLNIAACEHQENLNAKVQAYDKSLSVLPQLFIAV